MRDKSRDYVSTVTKRTFCALALLLLSVSMRAAQLATFSAETLAGKAVLLPWITAGRIAVFCIGFSHHSQSEVKRWSEYGTKQFAADPEVVVYSIAVLEDAPRLVRGMIVHAIKGSVPVDRRDRFLILDHNERQLKDAAGFEQPNAAYLLLVDQKGEIRWRYHGDLSDTGGAELGKQVQALSERR